VNIDKQIFEQIKLELKKERFTDLNKLTFKHVKKILKRIGHPSHYEHISYIISQLTGKPPPIITKGQYEEVEYRFKQTKEPFKKYKHLLNVSHYSDEARKSFLNYNYVLHKLFELMSLDDIAKNFSLLKDTNKLINHDRVWKLICRDLKWQFIPSI